MEASSKNEIEFREDLVVKTFHPRTKLGVRPREKAFRSELAAYHYFDKIRWAWAPRLKGHDQKRMEIHIERIWGRSLKQMIAENIPFDISSVVTQLIELDRLLWINRINCLQINPDDILIEERSSKIFMIDFEHTYLNSRFKKTLYNQLLGPKLTKIEENEAKTQFISTLQKSRSQFHKYYFRITYALCVWLCRKFLFGKKGDNILR